MNHPVDGSEIRDSPVEVGSLSHYLQGFSTIPTVGFSPDFFLSTSFLLWPQLAGFCPMRSFPSLERWCGWRLWNPQEKTWIALPWCRCLLFCWKKNSLEIEEKIEKKNRFLQFSGCFWWFKLLFDVYLGVEGCDLNHTFFPCEVIDLWGSGSGGGWGFGPWFGKGNGTPFFWGKFGLVKYVDLTRSMYHTHVYLQFP